MIFYLMRASHQKTLHRRRWREDNYSFSQKEKVFFWQCNISLIFDCHRCLNYCNESFFPSRRLTFWASTICLEPLLGCVSSKLQGRISENEWMIFFYNLSLITRWYFSCSSICVIWAFSLHFTCERKMTGLSVIFLQIGVLIFNW